MFVDKLRAPVALGCPPMTTLTRMRYRMAVLIREAIKLVDENEFVQLSYEERMRPYFPLSCRDARASTNESYRGETRVNH